MVLDPPQAGSQQEILPAHGWQSEGAGIPGPWLSTEVTEPSPKAVLDPEEEPRHCTFL